MKQPQHVHTDKLKNIQITALESAANGVVITDRDGFIIWVNPAITKLTGYTPEELKNKKTSIFRSHQHPDSFYLDLWRTISAGKVWRGEVINKKKDGTLYHEDMTITPVVDDTGETTHYIAIKQDITAFRKAVENLRESDERFRLLVNSVSAHFYIAEYSPNTGFKNRYLSENIQELTGYPLQKFLGSWDAWQAVIHPDDVTRWVNFIELLAKGISSELEYRITRADGNTIWVSNNAQANWEENGNLMIYATVTNITERKQTENQIRHLATHDPLTNLPNRIMFREILEHAISYSKRNRQMLGVFFLDVNDFKSINDSYGHLIGDKLLVEIANRLRLNLREYDTVSRISGDEFTLIAHQLKQFDHARIVAEKIYAMLSGEYILQDQRIEISVSVGGSIFPDHGNNYETLIRLADEAMYAAKKSEGPYFRIYDPQRRKSSD